MPGRMDQLSSVARRGFMRWSAFGLALTACFVVSGAEAPRGMPFSYSIIDLGTLGGFSSVALDINELGHVVGGADLSNGDRHAFFWADGAMTDLGTLGHPNSEAEGINELDQVVGISTNTGSIADAFIWQNGQMTEIGPNQISKSAYKINDAGQVVGVHITQGDQHPFIWQSGVLTDLHPPGSDYGDAWDINESGVAVGASAIVSPPGPYRWENGVLTALGNLGIANGSAQAINDAGQIVGWSMVPNNPNPHAFFWKNSVMENIGQLGQCDWSDSDDVNNQGEIIGMCIRDGYHAGFYYEPAAGFWMLEDLLPPQAGWTELNSKAINDQGQIVGAGTINGRRHAFLMNRQPPIPAIGAGGFIVLVVFVSLAGIWISRRAERRHEDWIGR